MAWTSLVVKIGAQDQEVQKALASLGQQAKTVDAELARLGNTPVGREALKSIEQIQQATVKLTEAHQRMADRAVNAARGLDLVGGASRLTTDELAGLNRIAVKGIDAFRALGQEAPPALLKMAEQTKSVTSAGGGFTEFLGKANGLLGAFGIGLSVGALVSFGKGILAAADNLTKLRASTGFSVENLQRFQVAGDDAGNTIEQLATASTKLSDNLVSGGNSTVAALDRLGLNLANIRTLSPDEQFIAISDAIRKIEDPAQQVNIAMDLFGRAGAQILPTLKRGFDDVKGAAVGMSTDTVEAIDDVGDALQRASRTATGQAANAISFMFLGWGKAAREAKRDVEEFDKMVKGVLARGGPGFGALVPPGLPNNLEEIEEGLDRTRRQLTKAAGEAKKAATDFAQLAGKVRELQSGLFAVPEALQKIGRGYDEAKLGPLVDSVERIERASHIAAFGFAGMTDALKNVGMAGEDVNDELKKLVGYDWAGPIQEIERVATTYEKVYLALDDVDQILSNIPGQFAEIGALAVRTGKAIMNNLAEGNVWGAVVAGIAGVATAISKLWKDTEKQINPVREQFVQLHGGLDALNRKARAAGVTLTAMLNAKNPEQYKKAIDELNAALEFQDQAMQTLDETVKRYGFTIEELGPAMQRQELDKQAQQLFKDWEVLNAAGIDTIAITGRMAESVNAYVNRARAMGIEVPSAMKPMLQAMIDQGLLTDAAGNKITNLEDSGISFAQTMSEGFKSVVDEVKKLAEAITRSLGGAIQALPTTKTINVDFNVEPIQLPIGEGFRTYAARGGLVTAHGMQNFAAGGRVLPFLRRGSDTVPAMLTPGEIVLNEAQQAQVSAAITGGMSTAGLQSELAGLRRDMARYEAEGPRRSARAMRDMLQTAGLRR